MYLHLQYMYTLAHNLIQHDSTTVKKNHDRHKIAKQMPLRKINAQKLKKDQMETLGFSLRCFIFEKTKIYFRCVEHISGSPSHVLTF